MERLMGTDIRWEIQGDTLYLDGSGPMNFLPKLDSDILDIPWYYLDFDHVSIGEGITSIGTEAFHTSDLVEVEIPDSVETIGEDAFCDCKSLQEVRFGNGVKAILGGAFSHCTTLDDVVLGESVESIGFDSFGSCPGLTRFESSPCLKYIGGRAFNRDDSLDSICLPATLETVVDNPFSYCLNLRSIDVDDGNENFKSFAGSLYDSDMKCLIAGCAGYSDVPEEVMRLGNNALAGTAIEELILPENVKSLGTQVCRCCFNLRNLDLGNVRTVPAEAFSLCESLEKVNLGMCRIIEPRAFADCRSLRKVDLPGTLESVGTGAFLKTNLEEITIPEALMDIGPMAFYSESLRKVSMHFPIGDEDICFPKQAEIDYLDD